MRVTTAFNKLLGLNATFVQAVNFEPGQIIVTVRLARRRLRCPDCTFSTRAIYDHRPKPSKWRHLDVCGQPLVIACSLRRLACPNHGVRIEQVPFARPGTRVTYDFENLVVWCVTSMDRTAATVLCRVAWRTVNKIIERVVPATPDLSRIKDLVHIGVDEISWKRGHKYLTLVVNHDTGDVIWGAKDRTAVTLEKFFEVLGPDKTAELEAISMDFGAPYAKAARECAPNAAICLDPFHAVAMATKALDETRRDLVAEMKKVDPEAAKTFKQTRYVRLHNPENLSDSQATQLTDIKRYGRGIWRAYQLKEALRSIYADHTLSFDDSRWLLDRWISRAQRSQLPQFIKLAKTLRTRFDEVTNAWFYGITNARNEGTHSAIRTIFARAHGFHTAEAALSIINLCCGPTPIPGPHPTHLQAA